MSDGLHFSPWIMAEVSPIHRFMSQQHERMHPGIIIAFVASYLLLARSMVLQIFSKVMFLQHFANRATSFTAMAACTPRIIS